MAPRAAESKAMRARPQIQLASAPVAVVSKTNGVTRRATPKTPLQNPTGRATSAEAIPVVDSKTTPISGRRQALHLWFFCEAFATSRCGLSGTAQIRSSPGTSSEPSEFPECRERRVHLARQIRSTTEGRWRSAIRQTWRDPEEQAQRGVEVDGRIHERNRTQEDGVDQA